MLCACAPRRSARLECRGTGYWKVQVYLTVGSQSSVHSSWQHPTPGAPRCHTGSPCLSVLLRSNRLAAGSSTGADRQNSMLTVWEASNRHQAFGAFSPAKSTELSSARVTGRPWLCCSYGYLELCDYRMASTLGAMRFLHRPTRSSICSQCRRALSSSPVLQAGHNKWSKVKHTKGRKDAKITAERTLHVQAINLYSKCKCILTMC